ncbi:MAG: PAS domain S-box protein, partial [Candidatus Electryoneaceae bacterium]|nr:PAS domain S-box protein [Candidatus Electryoneaceae bacterium]
MDDHNKTKEQLIDELAAMRQQIAEHEASETEHKFTEEAKRESETKYQNLVENAFDAIYLLQGRRYEYVNPRFCKLTGYSYEELTSSDFDYDALLPPEMHEFFKECYQARMEDIEIPNQYELQIIRKNGELVDVEVTTVSLGKKGNPLILGIMRDITERKQAEELQDAVYRISQTVETTESLDELYQAVHRIIQDVMVADNIYLALYDDKVDVLSFPYFIDERSIAPTPRKFGKGRTEYVLRTEKSFLCSKDEHAELIRRGKVDFFGDFSEVWLGVPLKIEGKTVGVLAVQHYSNLNAYGERETKVLEFVSTQVAKAIHHKMAEDALRVNENRMRLMVENLPAMVDASDENGNLILWNQECERV